MTRKVLVSPGYGAGWSTWAADDSIKELMLFWPPLIEALENGEKVGKDHPAVLSLLAEIKGKGEEPYLGGLSNLKVKEVCGQFKVTDYDGFESIDERDGDGWV